MNENWHQHQHLKAIETTRSAVARQESEILRLAEESQHVIINHMLNKLVKQSSIDETEIEITNNDDELIISGNNLDQIQTENETSFIIHSNYSSQKSIKKSNGTGSFAPLGHDARNYSQMFYAQRKLELSLVMWRRRVKKRKKLLSYKLKNYNYFLLTRLMNYCNKINNSFVTLLI